MKIYKNPQREALKEILQRPVFDSESLHSTVRQILNDIKQNGDDAVKRYTEKFDGATLQEFAVSEEELANSKEQVPLVLRNAIDIARKNIQKFHESQRQSPEYIETIKGVECWRKNVAIDKVGLYVPGGTAPLFSSVLMLGIPAIIAGCKEIVLCTPPDKDGNIHPAILYSAYLTGITKVYKIGGVQAIGAMAYGTESVPKVYKIFGPGNQYVTAAKQLVSMENTAIDMPAGPSEVLVLADEIAEAEFVAADLLSQAEHGVDSQVILITFNEKFMNRVVVEVEKQLKLLPRKDIATKALENSKLIYVDDQEQAIDMVNEYAPEHLIISVRNEGYFIERLRNAGSVFLGKYTPESAGDYASGTNHTLPTNGYAKMYSGVSLDSYVKKITFQRITADALLILGPAIENMAAAEHLDAHKNAVSIRLSQIWARKQSDAENY